MVTPDPQVPRELAALLERRELGEVVSVAAEPTDDAAHFVRRVVRAAPSPVV